MTGPRRLTAEKRRVHQNALAGPGKDNDTSFRELYKDALHDLDVADGERTNLAAARAQVAALLPLAQFGEVVRNRASCFPANHFDRDSQISLCELAEPFGLSELKVKGGLRHYIWNTRLRTDADTAAAAASYTAEVSAQARREALATVLEIMAQTVDGEPIQPAEIERRIMALAAPPEKEAP